jgi:hypothetical protein
MSRAKHTRAGPGEPSPKPSQPPAQPTPPPRPEDVPPRPGLPVEEPMAPIPGPPQSTRRNHPSRRPGREQTNRTPRR